MSLADRPVELPRPVAPGPRWHRPVLAVVAALLVATAAIVLWPSDDVAAPGPSTPAPTIASSTGQTTPCAARGPGHRSRGPTGSPRSPTPPWCGPSVGWATASSRCPIAPSCRWCPASEPHDLQRYASGSVVDLGVDTDAAFDQAAVTDAVTAACLAAFEPFVGSPPASSALQTAQTRPNADTWAAGDREYHCSVGVEGARVVGDAAGTGWSRPAGRARPSPERGPWLDRCWWSRPASIR